MGRLDLIPLVKYSNNITVVDINSDALRMLKERNLGISTVCGDFSQVSLNKKYSLVLCIEGPDYFPDKKMFFNPCHYMLYSYRKIKISAKI